MSAKPRDLDAWEARLARERGWTRKQCYQALDVSFDRYARMRDGRAPIRRHIALAMAAVLKGIDPYGLK